MQVYPCFVKQCVVHTVVWRKRFGSPFCYHACKFTCWFLVFVILLAYEHPFSSLLHACFSLKDDLGFVFGTLVYNFQ